jgi:hypothetical protein
MPWSAVWAPLHAVNGGEQNAGVGHLVDELSHRGNLFRRRRDVLLCRLVDRQKSHLSSPMGFTVDVERAALPLRRTARREIDTLDRLSLQTLV